MMPSISSSTGPQYCDWHNAGVANITAAGRPLAITWLRDTSCSGHLGFRVQMGSTPSVSDGVGDAAVGAAAPTTGASGASFTWTAKGTRWPCTFAAAFHTPAVGNTASTT